MTLIEKLISSVIIGVLATAAVPSWMGFVAAQEVKADGNDIETYLRGTQSEAKKQRLVTQSVLENCKTAGSCLDAQLRDLNQETCGNLIAALIKRPYLLYPFQNQVNYAVWEDGTCSLPTIFGANPTPLVPSAFPAGLPPAENVWSSQPSSALSVEKSAKTVTGKSIPQAAIANPKTDEKPKKKRSPKLKYEGCFRPNGQFIMQRNGQWSQVNFDSLPANTEINAAGKVCRELGVQ
jgi:type II secretory pathway pseudopilin PulG